jgi:hypothetical protein
MFKETREKLQLTLQEAGLSAHLAWADKPIPPAAYIVPPAAAYYLEGGQFAGQYEISMDVIVLVDKNAKVLVELENIESVIELILTATMGTYAFRGVDAPSEVTVYNVTYLGTVVHLAVQVRL